MSSVLVVVWHRARRTLRISGAAALLVACTDSGSRDRSLPVGPVPPPPQFTPSFAGRIAFVSDRDGTIGIYIADSAGIRRITPGREPSWSPDGTRIAFESSTGISIIRLDGQGRVDIRAGGQQPAWSPDGTRIAFRDGGIRIMTATGEQERLLVDDDYLQEGDELQHPRWSADGQRIAFVRYDCCWLWPSEIRIVRLDGASPTLLIPYVDGGWYYHHWSPAWSRDGRSLAFIHDFLLATAPADTTTFRTIDVRAAWESKLDWSPDDRFLLFSNYDQDLDNRVPPFTGHLRIFAAEVASGAASQIIPEAIGPVNLVYRDFDAAWAPVVAR